MLIAAGAASHLDQGRGSRSGPEGRSRQLPRLDADGTEIGLVKWVETGGSRLVLVHDAGDVPGPAFMRPTVGQSATRGQAARELGACYAAFRAFYQIEE